VSTFRDKGEHAA
jgi:threonine/homoserine/homoserine lactone efflux protein